jgi:hypothetical protein
MTGRIAFIALCAVCVGATSSAQTGLDLPGTMSAAGSLASKDGSTADATISVEEGYDANSEAKNRPAALLQSPYQIGGFYSAVTGDFAYALKTDHAQAGVTGTSIVRYYPNVNQLTTTHAVGAGFTLQLSRRTTLFANQSVAFAPAYLYGVFPSVALPTVGQSIPAGADYRLSDQRSLSYATSVSLTERISRRDSLSFRAGFSYTDFTGESAALVDMRSYSVGGRYTHPLRRNGSFYAGYNYKQVEYVQTPATVVFGTASPTEHGLDIGMAYDRPISRSRRTTIGFNVGSSVIEGPAGGLSIRPPGDTEVEIVRQFRVSGNFSVRHRFGRSWELRGAYDRGSEYIEGLLTPLFTDGATVATEGKLSRKVDFSAIASYSTGHSALSTTSASDFVTYTGEARLKYALDDTWSLYGSYIYYFYDFHDLAQPLAIAYPSLERNGVRGGLTMKFPLKQR